MAEELQHSGTVWKRLRKNRDSNAPIFLFAGVQPEHCRDVICPACGAEENAIFWSVTARKRETLHLLCPVCEQARVRYSLARNRPVDPVFTRGSVGGGMGVVAVLVAVTVLFFFRDSPPVQMIAEDVHNLAGALSKGAGRATGGVVGSPARPASRPSGAQTSGATAGPAGSGEAASGPDASAATSPSGAPAARVYVSRGDRRGDVDIYAARIVDRAGESELRLLLQVEYDPELDRTRVMVDPSAYEWPRRLTWLRGWRAAEP